VVYKVLNPKAITMGELYGEFNALTQEWHDGLASSIMKAFVKDEGEDRRWTVFDGKCHNQLRVEWVFIIFTSLI
jgi:dynein heavy chain